jgi:Acyl-CoA reductase (LuxC)
VCKDANVGAHDVSNAHIISSTRERAAVTKLGAEQIIAAVADAAERWRDADFPDRVRTTQAIVARTRYTEPVVDYALDALFGALDARTIRATIAGELGSIAALDGFVPRAGRPDVLFVPLEGVAIVSSDTTIGVAIPALAYALCAKASVLVKDRDDALVSAFSETVARERPELAERMRIETWGGNDAGLSHERLASARVVVAYGRNETLRSIRSQLHPEARFIPFGHRTSVGYVAREALSGGAAHEVARGLATDALLFDGEGCLSIHVAFVERGGALDPAAFAKIAGDACAQVAIEFPAGLVALDPVAAAIRSSALFRAAQGVGAVYAAAAAPHLVVLDPDPDEPPPWARRTLVLYAIEGPEEALAFLRRHALDVEAIGTAPGTRADITDFAVASGASRIALLGTLQRPPLGGEHGGGGRILPFVRAIYR